MSTYYSINAYNYVFPYNKKNWDSGNTLFFSPFLLGEMNSDQRLCEEQDPLNDIFFSRVKRSFDHKRACFRTTFNKDHMAFGTREKIINFNKKRNDIRHYINAQNHNSEE